jgi:hypothetical protein
MPQQPEFNVSSHNSKPDDRLELMGKPSSGTLEFTKHPEGHLAALAPTDYGATYTVTLTPSDAAIQVQISAVQVPSFPHCFTILIVFESSNPGFSSQFISGRHTFTSGGDTFTELIAISFDFVQKGPLTVTYAFTHIPEVPPPVTPSAGFPPRDHLCYLHSILQLLFHIPRFRTVLYSVDASRGMSSRTGQLSFSFSAFLF